MPQQRRCGKVYGQQGERAPRPEDRAEDRVDAAFVSPRDVSAAESQLIQSRYPHWFEECDGRKYLKLIVEKRKPRDGKPVGEPIHLLPLPPTEPAGPAASVASVESAAEEDTRRKRPRLQETPAGGITANGSSSASAAAASSSTSAGHSLATALPAVAAEPPIALSVLQQPGESDVDYQQKKSQLIGELSQVINMLATGRQPEGLQLLTLRTASSAYPGDEPNAALCRLVGSLLERLSHAEADAAAADAPVAAPAAAPAPLGGQVDVLLVVCTPAGLQALPQAPLEASAIGELLRASGRTHHCTTLTEGDSGGAAALNALMMHCEPRVVCFIGHGDARLPFAGDTTLGLANASGALELISPSTLATVLGKASQRVKLVVLNGCSTEKLCETISTDFRVPAIGWSTVAADVAAKLFSIAIFGCLARRLNETEAMCGHVVRDAFAHGERAIKVASRLVRGASGEYVQAWALADPMQPRERSAGEPIPAGLPVLLAPLPAEKLHNVPRLPSHHVARPEQLNLRDKLLRGRSGGGSMLSIVGKGFATRGASAAAFGIAGSFGLGKSTAAAWLAHDVRVQTAFGDGIFWLTFGREREALTLLIELAELAGVADGRLERAGRDAARVVQLIKERLAKKHCLVILDDVWRTQQPEPFRRLSEGTTTVLLTTRKRDVTDFFGATLLPLKQMPDEVALELLTEESGKSAEVLRGEASDELSRLLKLCCGLPAMLLSVGRRCSRMTVRAVLRFFDTHKLKHKVPKNMDAAEGYGNLFVALELQLNALAEEEDGETLERFCLMTAVFREDEKVPVSILPVLWDVDEDEALDCAQRLAKEHLIELSEDGKTMSLLDVHRDYYACRAKSELAGWHAEVLRRCCPMNQSLTLGPTDLTDEEKGSEAYLLADEGVERFQHHVAHSSEDCNLTELWVSGSPGADWFHTVLPRLPHLESLYLESWQMRNEGIAAFANALNARTLGSLKQLMMGDTCSPSGHCFVSDGYFEPVLCALETGALPSLQGLDEALEGNGWSCDPARLRNVCGRRGIEFIPIG